jgi:hypothetical protein
MGETNSPSVAHVGYDISPSREWRNIVTHRQLKENLYLIQLPSSYKASPSTMKK